MKETDRKKNNLSDNNNLFILIKMYQSLLLSVKINNYNAKSN